MEYIEKDFLGCKLLKGSIECPLKDKCIRSKTIGMFEEDIEAEFNNVTSAIVLCDKMVLIKDEFIGLSGVEIKNKILGLDKKDEIVTEEKVEVVIEEKPATPIFDCIKNNFTYFRNGIKKDLQLYYMESDGELISQIQEQYKNNMTGLMPIWNSLIEYNDGFYLEDIEMILSYNKKAIDRQLLIADEKPKSKQKEVKVKQIEIKPIEDSKENIEVDEKFDFFELDFYFDSDGNKKQKEDSDYFNRDSFIEKARKECLDRFNKLEEDIGFSKINQRQLEEENKDAENISDSIDNTEVKDTKIENEVSLYESNDAFDCEPIIYSSNETKIEKEEEKQDDNKEYKIISSNSNNKEQNKLDFKMEIIQSNNKSQVDRNNLARKAESKFGKKGRTKTEIFYSKQPSLFDEAPRDKSFDEETDSIISFIEEEDKNNLNTSSIKEIYSKEKK